MSEFTPQDKTDTIETPHSTANQATNFEPKEGQSGLLCGNKKLSDCPSLRYNFIENNEKLNKAFDLIFEEAFITQLTNNHYDYTDHSDHSKADSSLCESI
jgi:hypothetical protein